MNQTYRDLKNLLDALTAEQLDLSVTVYDSDINEYFPAIVKVETPDTDVLDPGHPVLIIS